MRTTLRRGAPLVATALLALVGVDHAQAQVAYTANTVTSVYYREFLKDGRYFVFNNAAAADAFEKSGETGVGITRIGIGPKGESVFADNETALELFLFKYGLNAEVKRPVAPPFNVVWRDGKTRFTLGSAAYVEMSTRLQPRFTLELPDENVQLPGTAGKGDSKGSFRIRRAKFKLEGWFYKPNLEFDFQVNFTDVTNTPASQIVEDANIDWDISKKKQLPREVRAVQGGLRAPAAHVVGGAAVRRPRDPGRALQRRARDGAVAVGCRRRQQARLARDDVERQRPHADPERQRQVPLVEPRDVAGDRQHAHGPVGLGRTSSPRATSATRSPARCSRSPETSRTTTATVPRPTSTSTTRPGRSTTASSTRASRASPSTPTAARSPRLPRRAPRRPTSTTRASWPRRHTPSRRRGSRARPSGSWRSATPRWTRTTTCSGNDIEEIGGALSYYYNKHALKVQADFRQIKNKAANSGAGSTTQEFRLQTQLVF